MLIFALSVLVSFCLVCPQNDSLAQIHFLFPPLAFGIFENADQEDLAVDSPASSKEIVFGFVCRSKPPGDSSVPGFS